jgi:hypothetical protein
MEQQLFSTVYVSSASGGGLSDADLADILRVSRANNQRDGITGMLLYKDGNIMQLLEGPKASTDALLGKIRRDHRHHGVQVLLEDQIAQRQFDQWAMAFRKVEADDTQDLEGRSDFLDRAVAEEAFRNNPGRAFRLLLSFRNNIR